MLRSEEWLFERSMVLSEESVQLSQVLQMMSSNNEP